MIANDEELRATHEALGNLYRALSSLRQTVLPLNPRQYALLAEGPVDEINKLQLEIQAYLGLRDPIPVASLADASPPYKARKKK